jgi:hypothetical protein
LIAIVVLVAVIAGAVALGGGGGESEDEGTDGGVDRPEGALTFSQAEEEGIDVTWPETCDTETGRVAIPSNFATECYAPFMGDNGGATSTGVTADTIKIVWYVPPPDPLIDSIIGAIEGDDTPEEQEATLQGFIEGYEQFYETYGRDVEMIRYDGTGSSLDEVAARADAVKIATEIEPFMVWGGPFLTNAFSDELASRGVLNMSLAASMPSDFYEERGPYLWTTLMTPDQTNEHVAEYVGKRLAGDPAIHAGDPDLRDQERKFGRIYLEATNEAEALAQQMEDELAEYDVTLTESVSYSDPVTLPNVVAEKIAKLKDAGVTSIIFIGDPLAPSYLTAEATKQEYFPEWILTGSALVDATTFARTYDQEQWSHAFGPSGLFARGRPEAGFAYGLYEWFKGEAPPAVNGTAVLFPFATTTFSGIQAAGPNLTPETYEAGLFTAGVVPPGLTNPQVSFGDHEYWESTDYSALDDMTEVWWDPEATGPDERGVEGTGMYEYVEGGVRYNRNKWPSEKPKVFERDGAVALYEELPESDRSGDYPSPAE